MDRYFLSIKGGVMEQGVAANGWWRTFSYAFGIGLILSPGLSWGLEIGNTPPAERRETISLADAALQALKHNLDINISRQTKESRQADITVEQAKFDPTLSVNGQYNRTVNPLNRPVFGATGGNLTGVTTFDQRNQDRKSTRLNSSHIQKSRMPSSA